MNRHRVQAIVNKGIRRYHTSNISRLTYNSSPCTTRDLRRVHNPAPDNSRERPKQATIVSPSTNRSYIASTRTAAVNSIPRRVGNLLRGHSPKVLTRLPRRFNTDTVPQRYGMAHNIRHHKHLLPPSVSRFRAVPKACNPAVRGHQSDKPMNVHR